MVLYSTYYGTYHITIQYISKTLTRAFLLNLRKEKRVITKPDDFRLRPPRRVNPLHIIPDKRKWTQYLEFHTMEEVRAFGWCISAASRVRILPDFSSAHTMTFACPWVADFASYMHACGRLLYIFSSIAVVDICACQGLFGMDNAMRFICFCEPTITNLSTSGPRHRSGQCPINPHVPTEP